MVLCVQWPVDPCFNKLDKMPDLDMCSLDFEQVADDSWLPAKLLLEFTAIDKKTKVRLADYGSLGLRGQSFQTWLNFGTMPTHSMPKNIPQVSFSKENPTRTFFVADVLPPGGSFSGDTAAANESEAADAAPPSTHDAACHPNSQMSIKLLGNDKIPSRRTRIDGNISMMQLLDTVGLPHGTALEYLDEGEWLILQTDADLNKAKSTAAVLAKQENIFKLRVAVD